MVLSSARLRLSERWKLAGILYTQVQEEGLTDTQCLCSNGDDVLRVGKMEIISESVLGRSEKMTLYIGFYFNDMEYISTEQIIWLFVAMREIYDPGILQQPKNDLYLFEIITLPVSSSRFCSVNKLNWEKRQKIMTA